MLPQPGSRCPGCGDIDGASHELGSAQVWDGGVRLVCQRVLCGMCKRTDPQFAVVAAIDRVPVCEHCLPLRRAVLARMARRELPADRDRTTSGLHHRNPGTDRDRVARP